MGEFAARIADKVKDLTDIPAPVAVPGDAAAPYYVPKGTDGQPVKFLKAKPQTDLGQVYRLRRLRPPGVPWGHQSLQRGGGARHLHQVPVLRPQVHEARQVL